MAQKLGIVPRTTTGSNHHDVVTLEKVWKGLIGETSAEMLMQSFDSRKVVLKKVLTDDALDSADDRLQRVVDDVTTALLNKWREQAVAAAPLPATEEVRRYVAVATMVSRLVKGCLDPTDGILLGQCLYKDSDTPWVCFILSQALELLNPQENTVDNFNPMCVRKMDNEVLFPSVNIAVSHVKEATGTLKLLDGQTYCFTLCNTPKTLRAHPVITHGARLAALSVQLIKVDVRPGQSRAQKVVVETRLGLAHNPASGVEVTVRLPPQNGHDVELVTRTASGASVVMYRRHDLPYDRAQTQRWFLRLVPEIEGALFGRGGVKYVSNLHPFTNEEEPCEVTQRMAKRHCCIMQGAARVAKEEQF